jgi:pantetheine-phosphate adenylyltransferase
VKEEITSLPEEDASRITVEGFEGLLVEFAKHHNASLLIRGLRAVSDFEYEFQMSAMNHKLCPTIQTVFLPASESTHYIASRLVKEVARLGGDVKGMVSDHVASALKKRFDNQ